MKKAVFVGLFSVALSLPVAANAQDSPVRFDGGLVHSRCAPAVW